MTRTDLSQIIAPFVLTLSPEEQEFVATYNLLCEPDWEACVPAGLVPQAIAYYIKQKVNRYVDELLHTSSGVEKDALRPEKPKKKLLIRSYDLNALVSRLPPLSAGYLRDNPADTGYEKI